MAVSRDGYLARERNDRMQWLGPADKAVFRVLTGVDGGHCLVSARTYGDMPEAIEGRTMHLVSRRGLTLEEAAHRFPRAWLLGGPTLAMAAIDAGLVTEAHLCRSDRMAFPYPMMAGSIPDFLTRRLEDERWRVIMKTRVLDVTVELWRPSGVIESEGEPPVAVAQAGRKVLP